MSPLRVLLPFAMALCLGCGGPPAEVEVDGGADAGRDGGGMQPDAGGGPDAGMADAGPPPRVVFGAMVVNGTPYTLSTGYGTKSVLNHQLRLATSDTVQPRVQVALVLPGDAGPGFSAACGGPQPVLFAGQWILDAGVAFFTLNPTCLVTLSQVANAIDEEYRGTFSGTVDLEPRSVLDAGFPVMTITGGTFTVRRTF